MQDYWVTSGMIDARDLPPLVENPQCAVVFEEPSPMLSRAERIANIEKEIDLGSMTLAQAIKELHPDYTPEQIAEVINQGIPV
jgi:hypothetical protein